MLFDVLAAGGIADDQFPVGLDAQIADLVRGLVGVHEAQADVGFDPAKALDQVLDETAQLGIGTRVTGDLDRALQPCEQRGARLRQGVASAAGPVRGVVIAGAEPGEETADGDQEDRRQGAV